MRFNIIGKSKVWIVIGILLMIASLAIFYINRNYSIEFTGGVSTKIVTNSDSQEIKSKLNDYLGQNNYKNYAVNINNQPGYTSILLKIEADESATSDLSNKLRTFFLDNKYVDSTDKILEMSIIGPSVGEYMKSTAIQAIAFGLIFIGVYILFAFSGMREFISPLMIGIITVITMIFDIALPMGAYGVLMGINKTIQIDIIFVISILTIMGYSINDTIIVFDRIRENFSIYRTKINEGKMQYAEIFEMSLWQTMRRSLGTSFTVFIVVLTMFIFGTGLLKDFSFVLMVGVIFGTYSSIFLAAPLAYILSKKEFHK